MEPTIISVISVVFAICSWIYVTREQLFEKGSESRLKNAFNKNRLTTVFVAASTVVITAVLLIEEIVLKNNSFLTNTKLLTLLFILMVAAVTDFKNHIIPNLLILTGLAARTVFYVIELIILKSGIFPVLKSDFIALLIVAGVALMGIIVKNGIAMGDVKLLAVMGLFLGLNGFFSSLFFSLILAFVVGIVLLVTKKKKRKDSIAFAPALFFGTLISVALTSSV